MKFKMQKHRIIKYKMEKKLEILCKKYYNIIIL